MFILLKYNLSVKQESFFLKINTYFLFLFVAEIEIPLNLNELIKYETGIEFVSLKKKTFYFGLLL